MENTQWRIHTLGSLTLGRSGANDKSPVTQRRRLAILAILAAAGNRGTSRDTLIALLWPDGDIESGRHSLRQTLYGLRRDLGATAVEGTTELRLDSNVMSSDFADFEDAISRSGVNELVRLYRGPFLAGFHLGDSGEFERWVESSAWQARSACRTRRWTPLRVSTCPDHG